jgi:hypothetical protein
VSKDEASAVALATKACEEGDAAGCFSLGVLFEQGNGVDVDQARAKALYARACEKGEARGCLNSYTDACDGGKTRGCVELGSLFEQGHGVRKNEEYAATLYTKACDGGEAEGCFKLGVLFEEGAGVDQDRARAAQLYTRACKGGDASACAIQNIKTYYTTMLRGLARRNLVACQEPAPADAVRATTNSIRRCAGAPTLPASDLNMRWEQEEMISPLVAHLASSTGAPRVAYARALMGAPTTLVVDVESEVEPTQTLSQQVASSVASGVFKPGSLTVRQVRFNSSAKAVCETRVVLKNSFLLVKSGSTWAVTAREQLRMSLISTF